MRFSHIFATVKSHPALKFIFLTAFIDMMGVAIIIPVAPDLIMELTGLPENEASAYGGYLAFAYAGMQYLMAPLIGILSDKYGRRPLLLLSLIGLGIDYLLHAFAPTLAWLFLGRILAGMCGASHTVASAYIADISTKENRAKNFGILGAAFGLGFVIGPAIGGIAGEFGSRVPFFIAAGLSFINAAYGFFILPESLAEENRREVNLKRANPVSSLAFLNKYGIVLVLAVVFFFINLSGKSVESTWSFYTKYRFDWSPMDIGISLALVGVIVSFVQAVLVGYFNKIWGAKKTIYVGMFCWTLGLTLFGIATEGWMMYAFILPYCFGGFAGPTLQSVVANQVPDKEQGEVQGGLTSLVSLSYIIGPVLFTQIFEYFTSSKAPADVPGMAFFTGGIFMVIAFFIAAYALRKLKPSD